MVINPRRACAARVTVATWSVCVSSVCLSVFILALQATTQLMSDILLKRDRVNWHCQGPRCSTQPIGVSMCVRKYTGGLAPPSPLASHLTSCPAQRGKADVQSGLPADAASLRETGSVDRYTPCPFEWYS